MNNNYSNYYKETDNYDDGSLSNDLSLLTPTQRALIESIRRDYMPQVLKDKGLLEDSNDKAVLMMNDIDKVIHHMEFVLKHYQRIQKMELNLKELWESYDDEIDSFRKSILYEHLVAFQLYLSAYYFALSDKLNETNTIYFRNM